MHPSSHREPYESYSVPSCIVMHENSSAKQTNIHSKTSSKAFALCNQSMDHNHTLHHPPVYWCRHRQRPIQQFPPRTSHVPGLHDTVGQTTEGSGQRKVPSAKSLGSALRRSTLSPNPHCTDDAPPPFGLKVTVTRVPCTRAQWWVDLSHRKEDERTASMVSSVWEWYHQRTANDCGATSLPPNPPWPGIKVSTLTCAALATRGDHIHTRQGPHPGTVLLTSVLQVTAAHMALIWRQTSDVAEHAGPSSLRQREDGPTEPPSSLITVRRPAASP